ncbi:MAG: ABC transporter permease [Acetobacteraceae bacterium]|nr:ABC transporter permease [Acetobacteraceae bacterium]
MFAMSVALRGYTVLVLLFLVAPLLVVVPLSFSSGEVLTLPVPGFSLRWYADFFTAGRWLSSTRNSLVVGLHAAAFATLLGTLAAFGLFLARPGTRSRTVLALLSLPLVVPSVIAGVAMYFAFAMVGLTSTLAGLILAHTVLALPYVVVTVLAGLQGFDRTQLRAATSLGAPFHLVLRRVVLPQISPAVAAGALFAFATSFDELIVALFIAGPEQFTLPRQMLAGLREFLSPTICAAAVLLTLMSLLLLALHQALLGPKGK